MAYEIHATDMIKHRALQDTVTVDKAVIRTGTGGAHDGSRKAIIARARKENPQYANAAVREIFYGSTDSKNTVIRFDPRERTHNGL